MAGRLTNALTAACAWAALVPACASAANVGPPQIDRAAGSRILTVESSGTWVPPAAGYSYSWFLCSSPLTSSCSQPVPGGTSYVLRTGAIGSRVRALVTDTSGSDSAFSNAVGPIAAAPPSISSPPQVSGSPQGGQALATTPGRWSGLLPGDPAFTYRWQRCSSSAPNTCADIPGTSADAARYPVGAADVGSYLRVVVGAEGLGRAQAAAPKVPVGPVRAELAGLKRLSPFPVVVIAGRLRGSVTQINDFVVRGPRRAQVRVRCKGRRCPFGRIGGKIGKRGRLRFRRAQRRFRAGQVLEIRVTGRNRVGKFTQVRFRRGRTPRRSDSCLRPGATRPSPCGGI